MRINHKQQEIIEEFLKKAQERFPGIQFKNISASPDDPEHIWINVISNLDEKTHLEFLEFEVNTEVEIDDKYGYRITMMEDNHYAKSA